jgi:chloramphenicol 3-O phosphotransferase
MTPVVMMSDMHTHRPGRIIRLNGTSSSGKTSISACLLELLDPPHFHMAVDAINAMRAKGRTRELASDELPPVLRRTRAGFHRAVAGMAAAGNDVVMDHVLSEAWRLRDCLELFAPFEVTFVAVRCPLEELLRRERARGDRPAGTAAAQYDVVHAHDDYDIEVDTGAHTAAQCAHQIVAQIARLPQDTAFVRLRHQQTRATEPR